MSESRGSSTPPESLMQKAMRHLMSGDIDPSSIARGVSMAREHLSTGPRNKGILRPPLIYDDYRGITGLTVARYKLEIPYSTVCQALSRSPRGKQIQIAVHGYPPDSQIQLHVAPNTHLNDLDYALQTKGALAAFSGPTTVCGVPNNGFIFNGKTVNEFKETTPPGQRRGALCFYPDGRLHLVNDTLKWEILQNGFSEITAMVGTSNFIGADDDMGYSNIDKFPNQVTTLLSYLMQYVDQMGILRTAYVHTNNLANRWELQTVMCDYATRQHGVFIIATELEFCGSVGYIFDQSTGYLAECEGYGDGFNRYDHYVVVRK